MVYVALLRAVNVGGTGKLAMSDLRALCEEAGFDHVATYIQSGNVVFASKLGEARVKSTLEKLLTAKMGKPQTAVVRSAAEIEAVRKDDPFASEPPNRVYAFFMDDAPPKTAVASVKGQKTERLVLRGRELYVHYPDGMGTSKLVVPFAKTGTARNMNTVAKLAEMAARIA